MLKVLREKEILSEPCALLLGAFDGLHLGHRVLLDRAKESGLPVCITTILGGKGKELFTREERKFLFFQNGVQFALEIPFTEELKATSAEDFLQALFSRLNARLIVCGEDFRFGRGAEGTPALLKEMAPCPVFVQETVGEFAKESGRMRKFSTSACKRYLKAGELSLLNRCLKPHDAYFIGGEVEHGRQVGRTYGFPTLNLRVPEEKLLPPDGVYGGFVATPKGNFPSIVNIGPRPTFGEEERKIEAYLDGFSGDLYGANVRVYPMEFFRSIERFPSAEALREQLNRDIARLKERHI